MRRTLSHGSHSTAENALRCTKSFPGTMKSIKQKSRLSSIKVGQEDLVFLAEVALKADVSSNHRTLLASTE